MVITENFYGSSSYSCYFSAVVITIIAVAVTTDVVANSKGFSTCFWKGGISMPENRGCGCGFGFGDDCIWIIIVLILICCCCGGNGRSGCC